MDILPGMVFYLPFTELHGRNGAPRNKYAIVIRSEPTTLTFVASTDLPRFVRKSAELSRSCVELRAHDYGYLSRDSWVYCNDIKEEYSAERINEKLADAEGEYLGFLHEEDLTQILGAVERSKLLEPRYKKSISSALNKTLASKKKES